MADEGADDLGFDPNGAALLPMDAERRITKAGRERGPGGEGSTTAERLPKRALYQVRTTV